MVSALAFRMPEPAGHIIRVSIVGPESVSIVITLCGRDCAIETTRKDLESSNLFEIGFQFGDWMEANIDPRQLKFEDLFSKVRVERGGRKAKAMGCNLVEFFAGIISESLRRAR